MKIFGFSVGKSTPKKKKIFNRGRYQIVDGSQYMIQPSSVDNRTEDEVLDSSKRAKLLDLTRNLVRNSSLFNTILGQMTTNVVSTVGGKVVLNMPNEHINDVLKRNFFQYTRNVDFYGQSNLNTFLKRILREYIIGGDCVLLFDDKLVEDSGKILFFEANEIVDVPLEEVQKRYGKNASISNGKVYSENGRHIGTVVSKSQRGKTEADPKACYFLKKDPNASSLENGWFHFSCNWREGRGVSQAASAIATIHQLEDLVQSELMASRRNSQIFCWLTSEKRTEEQLPSAFEDNTDFESMSDEEIEQAAQHEASEVQTISFNKARENSVVYEALPEGITAQQLQMNHPNSNVEVMVDWLANRVAASLGMSKVFATGNPEDGNWRANQLFAYPTILEFQKQLEQVCDWLFFRYVQWLVGKGEIEYFYPSQMEYVSWQWKGIDDLNPVEHQTGLRMALENNTTTYAEILGNNWKEKMRQVAYEHKWMNDNGLTHPSDKLLSGGQTEASKKQQMVVVEEK